MSEPLTKNRPSIDLDDFERRLRQHEAPPREDPLAELARLVGEHHDPYVDVFAHEAIAHAPQGAPQMPHHAAAHQAYEHGGRREPAFAAAQPTSPRLSGDFAAIEAGLRGALAAHPEAATFGSAADHEFYGQHDQYAQQHVQPEHYAQTDQAFLQDHAADQWAAPPQPHVVAPKFGRGRKPVYAMVATIAVGVIGIGVAFAYKGTSSSPREIKTITAASGPAKIQPPADAANDQGNSDSAMLGKKGQDAPTRLVSREEQPVDVSQAVQENASRNPDTGTSAPGDAANVPVPPSPSQAEGSDGFGAGMPPPKKVKVVSVRPDGTILPNDAPPPSAMPISRQASAKSGDDEMPVAKASTPKTNKATKTTSRVASTKSSKLANKDDGDDVAAPKSHKSKAQRVASAEPSDDTTASLGTRSGGGFAVQLAAPGSESDARSASSRLAKKFSSALAGHRLGFHKAQSNGKAVYRVRVGSLSKPDAVALCEKLKADGGSCFIAKNN